MRSLTLSIAAMALTCIAGPALAQEKGWFPESKSGEDLYDINFPGGTAAEYYKELGLELEGRLNVIVQEGVDLVDLPAVHVRNIEMIDLADLPQRVTDALVVEGTRAETARPPGRPGQLKALPASTIVVKVQLGVLQHAERVMQADSSARRFDLRFSGGTILDYVKAIRSAYPRANILAMPGVDRFQVPAVTLEGVTVDAALEAIEGQVAMLDGAWAKVMLSDADIAERDERVFTVSLEMRDSITRTKIWSVSEPLMQGATEADLLSAVQAALSISENEAVVRFHPQTQVLIVRGNDEALDTVRSTLEEVLQSARKMQEQGSLDKFWRIRQDLEERVQALEKQVNGKPSQ
ncbi:MAG: hypothetical protein H6814_10965 [Phycisphaeraceae bacterium]|nr:hypothetical protein [Phycisphaeraceae bacterium]